MSNISDRIERMIDDLLDQHNGIVEISRNKLAEEIRVVPSQISYVLTTRFSNNHGYVVEGRVVVAAQLLSRGLVLPQRQRQSGTYFKKCRII